MAARVAAHPEILRARKGIIEHCFGTLKRGWGFDHFLCRGLRKVGVEMSLAALAYNLKRAIKHPRRARAAGRGGLGGPKGGGAALFCG